MKIVLVAAIGDNLVIGHEGQLPWHLKSDLQHFRKVTLNRPVIMGRKTHESIGKLLGGRTNIVLTRDLRLLRAPCWRRVSMRRLASRVQMRQNAGSMKLW